MEILAAVTFIFLAYKLTTEMSKFSEFEQLCKYGNVKIPKTNYDVSGELVLLYMKAINNSLDKNQKEIFLSKNKEDFIGPCIYLRRIGILKANKKTGKDDKTTSLFPLYIRHLESAVKGHQKRRI
jgi:hypothetical protein